jgi:hypothetical protein
MLDAGEASLGATNFEPVVKTISSNKINYDEESFVKLDMEDGNTDNPDEIIGYSVGGVVVFIYLYNTQNIVVRHNQTTTSGRIALDSGNDMMLDNSGDRLVLMWDDTVGCWTELT